MKALEQSGIVVAAGVDDFRPVGGQVFVERLLVKRAGFAIDADEKRLVAKWLRATARQVLHLPP